MRRYDDIHVLEDKKTKGSYRLYLGRVAYDLVMANQLE